ncbi:MAG: quinone-dependent dihydroorotate dehydrogenase [Bacteroidia bacterium]|nr:quinone-dependent dihydroorotate dehydrogenase [Bacteroidia bacterium]
MYRQILRPLLFSLDPERVHHLSFRVLDLATRQGLLRRWMDRSFTLAAPALEREVFGLRFPNPLGLAAGFDKDGLLADRWQHLGFGFAELGTVTPRPQAGNPRPRLFRLPADQALINRMGFNNAGVKALAARLRRRERGAFILGANIGKNKDTPNEQAAQDYRICFEELAEWVEYFVVNVSSPNTPGLRSLQEKGPLTELLGSLQALNQQLSRPRPLLLKIAPDLTEPQLDDIVDVARTTRLSGLVAANTTISRAGLRSPARRTEAIGAGGLSGAPLRAQARTVLQYLHQRSGGSLPLIGAGGIMTPQDARERLADGAALIQTYTGFVYGGPGFARQVLRAL